MTCEAFSHVFQGAGGTQQTLKIEICEEEYMVQKQMHIYMAS